MFEEKYRHMYEQISPSKELVDEMRKEAAKKRGKTRGRKAAYASAAAGVLLVSFFSMSVLAANVPAVHEVIYTVSPALSQLFMPVKKSCVDQGIKMEVLSAYIHGDTARIYVTLQDLEGDRVDESTDLYNYTIFLPYGSAGTCERTDYDAKTRTATFLVCITQWDKKRLEGDKITFSITRFLSHKEKYEGPVDLDLGAAAKEMSSQLMDCWGSGGMEISKLQEEEEGKNRVLMPQDMPAIFPLKDFGVVGAGYVNGLFHIQAVLYDRLKTDSHGCFYLQNAQGERIDASYSVSFSRKEEERNQKDYEDFVFDVPMDKLGEYELYGYFATSGLCTDGNWQVTFPLENTPKEPNAPMQTAGH